jgi:hypothetical protein
MKCLLTLMLLLLNFLCIAQKRKVPKCPPAVRSSSQYLTAAPEQWFAKAEAGFRHSLMYRNAGGYKDNNFRFISRPQPYIGLASGYSFNNQWGIFLGVLATQTSQGLQFRYGADGYRRKDNFYQESFQSRFSLGATYSFADWKIYLAPAVVYNSLFSTLHHGGSLQSGTASPLGYTTSWPQPNTYDEWSMGIDASIEKKITRRLYGNVNAAIDFHPSVPTSATATVEVTAAYSDVYRAEIQPYLCYIGLGLSYRMFSR